MRPTFSSTEFQSRTHCQLTVGHLLQNGREEAEQHATNIQEQVEHYYNQHARALQVGSNVAIRNTVTKLWDIYGVETEVTPNLS